MTLTRHNKLSTVKLLHHNNKIYSSKLELCFTIWPVTLLLNKYIVCDRFYLVCIWSSHTARVRINRVRLPILLVVS